MLRAVVTCCQCPVRASVNKKSISFIQLRWKAWSSTTSVVTKPVNEEQYHESEQTDNSKLPATEPTKISSYSKPTVHTITQRIQQGQTLEKNGENICNDQQLPTLAQYFPPTVVETIESVRNPVNRPLKLVNATDPAVLEKAVKLDVKSLLKCYLGLSKSRLTGLVVVTAMAGYALAPAPFAVDSFIALTVGTALTSAAANTVNQIVEVPYDSQMDRTKNRVLVKQKLSTEHAAAFAAISGVTGLTLLTVGANGLTAALGGLNLLLYTCVYTPMKRQSIANTWVGSVVGGIPPLMGWVACTGEITHGALLLAGVLYAWQFPHFNALSWNLRNDYNKAGYKMMAVSHPELCRKTSLRYSLSLILISSLAPVCNVTSWFFVIDSLPLNGYLAYLAYRFYQEGDSASSRKLFRFSLIHLPTLILLMMVSKQAYKDKTKECPITGAISESKSVINNIPPSPPIFASLNYINEDVHINCNTPDSISPVSSVLPATNVSNITPSI